MIDVGEHIREIGPMLERLAGKEVALLLDVAPTGVEIELDPSQLEPIIVNLVVNARDAMPDGGTLTVQVERDGDEAVLLVADTGCGISADARNRSVEPLLEIVKQNRGSLTCDSAVGEGSSFEIRFPIASRSRAEKSTPPVRDVSEGGNEIVLLVEDDDLLRLACYRALDGAGYRVFEAHNAGEAILLAEEEGRVDLLVTDVALPRVDGPQLARHMNRIHPETKVLFLSGYGAYDARVSAIHDTCAPFLAKPFTPHTLLSKVRETLCPR